MQFPVPKNIDLEDKIIGPMTLRQFLYVLVGGGIAYSIFKKMTTAGRSELGIIIALPIALFSLALAFVKIQERPFGDFLASLVIFMTRPRQRVWKREEVAQNLVLDENKAKTEKKVQKKPLNVRELSDLTKVLDGEEKQNT